MSTYLYTAPDGDTLEIVPARGGIFLVAADEMAGHRARIEVDESCLDEMVAAMYRAAGRPAPIVLERTDTDDWARVTGTAGAA